MDKKQNFFSKELECIKILDSGSKCTGPALKGTSLCRHHKERTKKLPALIDEHGNVIELPQLKTLSDIVAWKTQIIKLTKTGKMELPEAESFLKLLTSLEDSMIKRDKADPNQAGKFAFTVEAAQQAAKRISGERAAQLLKEGGFMDFLRNDQNAQENRSPQKSIEIKSSPVSPLQDLIETPEPTPEFIEAQKQLNEDLQATMNYAKHLSIEIKSPASAGEETI